MSYITTVLSIQPDHLLGYWSGVEDSGTEAADLSGNDRDGVYSNVLLGQTGIGDTSTAPSYNGTNSHTDLYSASLAAAFNGQEGSTGAWIQMDASIWTTSTARRIVTFQSDTSNRVILQKTASNTLSWTYQAGNVTEAFTRTVATSEWVHIGLTWSKTANQAKMYFNGALVNTATNLGTYAAVPLDAARTLIGSSAPLSTAAVWLGKIAHVPLWDVALTADEMRLLAMVFAPVDPVPARTVIVARKDRTVIVYQKDRTVYA